jgi:spore germination protein KB
VLGPGAAKSFNYPYIESMRFARIGEFVERIDILFIGIYIMIILIEFIVVFYVLTHGVAHLTGMKSVSPLVLPICFLVVGIAKGVIKDAVDFTTYLTHVRTITSPFFALFLPLLLLLISRIRFGKLQKSEEDMAADGGNEMTGEKASN